MVSNVDYLFTPRSVAVIGASNKENSVGNIIIYNMLLNRFKGIVYPVNPSAKSIFGIKSYSTINEIPDAIDLAVVVVPAHAVIDVMEQCGEKGVKAAIIISAGFKEIGEEGAKLEEKVGEVANKYGIRLVGPNCFGIINTSPNVSLNTTFSSTLPYRGNIAFISQSGALCEGILDYARYEKIGFSKFISVGNRADITEAELLDYLGKDSETDLILMYIESLSKPQDFLKAAVRITDNKPIIAIKSGSTKAGARAMISHTGSMAGSDEVYEGVFDQAGIIRVDSVHNLFKAAKIFSKNVHMDGDGVAILTNSGGPGVMAADASARNGLELPYIDDGLLDELKSFLPVSAGFHNPVDVLGDADVVRYSKAMNTLLKSDKFSALINIITPVGGLDVKETIKEIEAATKKYNKPSVVCLFGLSDLSEENRILDEINIPHFEFPEDASWSLSLIYKYYQWKIRKKTEIKHYSDVDAKKAADIIRNAKLQNRHMLSINEAYEVLKAYKISTPSNFIATSREQLAKIGNTIGYPVVMKILSNDIVHKFDVGGVITNIATKEDLLKAYDDMISSVRLKVPNARIDGVVVEDYIPDGKETIIGMVRDPAFGPILMFGLGGIYVEALHDVSFRLAPIRELSAEHMVKSIRSYKLLTGVRGEQPTDLDAIVDMIKRISQLVTDIPEIKELDINPLIARPKPYGSFAVDVRIAI